MNCNILDENINKNYLWKEINLTEEFKNSTLYKFRHILHLLNNKSIFYLQNYFLNKIMKKYNSLTYGGFLENRAKLIGFLEKEKNNMIHLGIDINNIKPGTSIYTPCDCEVVHIFNDKTKINGWGGRVILKMKKKFKNCDYLLYGHLKHIDSLNIGQRLKKGDIVGYLGDIHENGGWFPHLHVQCIKTPFYEMYKKNLENLDGYWFHNINYTILVEDPTYLVFSEKKIEKK